MKKYNKNIKYIILGILILFQSYKAQDSINQIVDIDWEENFTYTDNKGWVIEQKESKDYYNYYTNSFDSGDPKLQCSHGTQFGVFGGKVSKTYSGLPKHYEVNVNLGITYILSWDDEQITVKLDSNTVYDETLINFNNFVWDAVWDDTYKPCDINSTQSAWWKSVEPNFFSFTISHTSSNLNIEIIPNINESIDNENIGIQNVVISVRTCYYTCSECDGPLSTDCTACPSNSTQNGTECQCNVGFVAYENDCIASCPSGFTSNSDRVCINDCPVDNCQTCVDNICTVCEGSYKLLNGNCYDRCPWFTTDAGSSCTDSTFNSITDRKYYAVTDLINTNFNPLDLQDNYTFMHNKQYNGNTIQSYSSTSSNCFGDNRQLLVGFGIYNKNDNCTNGSIDCKIKRSFNIDTQHYKVLVRVHVIYGEFNDATDYIKIYIDGTEVSSTQPPSKPTNDCGNKFEDGYNQLSLEVNHTQSTLEIAFEPYMDSLGIDEWFGIREFSIIVYQCITEGCATCSNQTSCDTCLGSTGQISSRVLANQCQCPTGHYDIQQDECAQCVTLKCDTCDNNSTCLTCNGNLRSGDQCECPSQLYWDNFPTDQDCQSCVNNRCLTCSNGADCDTCKFDTLNNRIQTSQCACPDEYFDDSSEIDCQPCTSNCFTCVTTSSNCVIECDHKCTSCSGSQSTCNSCRGDRILSDNCDCGYHKYDDDTSELCQECHDTCEDCLLSGCQTCRGNRETANASNMDCVCPTGGLDHSPTTYYCTTCQAAVLQKVELSDDYLQIHIQFFVDIEIYNFLNNEQILSNELCTHLFKQTTLDLLGGNVQCIIESTDGLLIQFQQSPTINIGDTVEFNEEAIKQSGCSENFNTFVLTELTMHSSPLPPSVLIQGPTSEISLCEEQQLLIINITNDGYRGLKDITWSLQSTDDSQSQDFEDLLGNYQNKFFVDIPSLFLNEFKEYVVQVQYSNMFNVLGISTIQIDSGSYKGVYANIKKTDPFIFKNFKQISFEGTIKYLDCLSGQIEEKNQVLNVQWIQTDSTNTETILSEYQSADTDRTTEITIEPYQHVAGQTYQISLIASLPDNSFVGQNQSDYKIEIVPLLVYIQGGNRMNAYASPLDVQCVGKDPNIQKDIQSEGITFNWECINMNNNSPCEQIDGTLITFDNGTEQTFAKKIFEPYNALLFSVEGTKNTESQIGQAVIIIVETNIPLLVVNVPESFLSEKLNKNDDLQIDILNESEKDEELFFSLIFIYDFEVVATKSFEYKSFSFRIWDLFDDFIPSVSELLVRVSMYNPKYFMPSQTSYNIQVNQPPQQGSISVTPLTGNALETQFQIELNGYVDNDSPLSYKYQFYTSLQKYELERQLGKNPTSSQKNVITDFRSQNSLSTILPQGDYNESNDQYELLIMVTVSDSLGGITNVTQTIQCGPNSSNSESQNIDILQNIFDTSETKNTEDQVKDLNLLAIQMQQMEVINQDITENTDYSNVKINVYEKLNEFVNLIPTKVLQDQAIKSINQLIKDPNLVTNQSQQNIESSISEMETILQNKQVELDQIKNTGLINSGDSKITRRNQEASLLLGNQIKFMDQMTNSFQYAKQRRRRFLTDEDIQNNQDRVYNLTKQINKALQTNSLPNEDAVDFQGDSFKQTVQKNNSKKIKQRFFQDSTPLNGFDQSDTNSNFDNSDDGETEVIYETSTQTFKDNILKDKAGFPYPGQNEQMYDIDISNNKNPDKQIDINESITTSFGKVGSKKNQVCISQNKDSDEWNNSACKNVEKENSEGKLEIQCECKSLTPTTVVQDLDNVFTDSTIGQAFGDEGLKALANFKFWKSIIFYIFILKTGLLVYLVYKGYQKDKKDFKHVEEQKMLKKEKEEKVEKADNGIKDEEDVDDAKINKLNLDMLSNQTSTKRKRSNRGFKRNKGKVHPAQETFNQDMLTESYQDSPNMLQRNKDVDTEIDFNESDSFRNSIKIKKSSKFRQKKKANKFQALDLENSKETFQEDENTSSVKDLTDRNLNNNENNQNQDQKSDLNSQKRLKQQNIQKITEHNSNLEDDTQEQQDKQSIQVIEQQQTQSKDQISNQDSTKKDLQESQNQKDFDNKIKIDQQQEQEEQNTKDQENKEDNKEKEKKKEPVYIQQKEVINFVLRIHELLGIHYLYDPKLSRPVRYLCFYLKICIVLGFTSSVIDDSSTQYESILISSVTSIVSSIPIAILKGLLSKKNIVKYIGFLLYLGVCGASVFLMITNAALMGVETSNNWTMAYFSSFLIDVFFYQVLAGFGKLAIFNWSIGKQGCPLLIRKLLALDKGMSKYFTRDNLIDDLDISV